MIRTAVHSRFERKGDDLYTNMTISLEVNKIVSHYESFEFETKL